eukprot:2069174-Prorocentrum_lima.AAC.1
MSTNAEDQLLGGLSGAARGVLGWRLRGLWRCSCQVAKCSRKCLGSSILRGPSAVYVLCLLPAAVWRCIRRSWIVVLSEGTCCRNVSHVISSCAASGAVSDPGELDAIAIGSPLVMRASNCCRVLILSLCETSPMLPAAA